MSLKKFALSLLLLTVTADPVLAQANQVQASTPVQVKGWFKNYDQIRRQAQMTPVEKQQADNMMSQGLSMFVPGEEKLQAQKLLTGLSGKYAIAMNQIKQLPVIPETSQLQQGYFQYFSNARALFNDYIRVQNEPFAKDPNTGERLLGQVMRRKQALTELEANIKGLDQNLRSELNVAPYQY